jgi:hypothetical protein
MSDIRHRVTAAFDAIALIERLAANGDITEADRVLLAADWRSLQRSPPGAARTAVAKLDEEAYWSLRLLRDLSRALCGRLGHDFAEPEIERALHDHERRLVDALRRALDRRPSSDTR